MREEGVFLSSVECMDVSAKVGVEGRCSWVDVECWRVDGEEDEAKVGLTGVVCPCEEVAVEAVEGDEGYWLRGGAENSPSSPRLLPFKLSKAEVFTNPVELFRLGSLGKVNPGAPRGMPCVDGGCVGGGRPAAVGPRWKGKLSKSPW